MHGRSALDTYDLETRRRWLRGGLILALAMTAAACATTRVDVARDPEAEFGRYDTFSFRSPLGTDRESGTGTVLSTNLRRGVRQQLESLGYRYVEDGGDLVVNFFVETQEVLQGWQRPSVGIGYGWYHRHYNVWADYDTDLRQYTEGTLHVDVIDAARDQLVWEGIAQRRLSDHDFTFEPEELDQAIERLFQRFPRRTAPD